MGKKPIKIYFILFLLWHMGPPLQAAMTDPYQFQAARALRACLSNEMQPAGAGSQLLKAVNRFYEDRQYKPAWMGSSGLTEQGTAMMKVLSTLGAEGMPQLKAFRHNLEMILRDGNQMMSLTTTFPLDALLKADFGMTQIALYFIIRDGIVYLPQKTGVPGSDGARQPPMAEKLANGLQFSTWNALVRASIPREKPYLALKKSLERFETIQRLGGWPPIPEGKTIRPGRRDPRVPLLRKRLIISGDLGLESLGLDELLDAPLTEGVRRFQQRHGLKADGSVGPDTLAELNIDVQKRITQIRLNLERWRRISAQLGPRYLLVNIPGFRLDVVENHQIVESMRAIVGRTERRTPAMSAIMTYLEINPYWNIPQQIAGEDILPKIHDDPRYLLRQNIQVFDSWRKNAPALDPMAIDWMRYSKRYFPFRLRQEPSASNALGQFKFIFPNRFSVYIHDTPAKSLFSRNTRSFSSGCVRIEEPLALASYLLATQGWDSDEIEKRANSLKRKVVVLEHPIPVHLVYLTVWTDENGTIHFSRDLYGCDERRLEEPNGLDGIQPPSAADLIAIDRILEKNSDRAVSNQSVGNGHFKLS